MVPATPECRMLLQQLHLLPALPSRLTSEATTGGGGGAGSRRVLGAAPSRTSSEGLVGWHLGACAPAPVNWPPALTLGKRQCWVFFLDSCLSDILLGFRGRVRTTSDEPAVGPHQFSGATLRETIPAGALRGAGAPRTSADPSRPVATANNTPPRSGWSPGKEACGFKDVLINL